MFRAAIAGVVIATWSSTAWSQPHKDALVILAVGDGVAQEVADDLTEALLFAPPERAGVTFDFLPKEQVQAALGYESPSKPGDCVMLSGCLAEVRQKLGARYFTVGRLTRRTNGYRLSLIRLGKTRALDHTRTANVPDDVAALLDTSRRLALAVLDAPEILLQIDVTEAPAPEGVTLPPGERSVRVDGQRLAAGVTRIRRAPGKVKIVIEKPGYRTFEDEIDCKAGAQCVVTAQLAPLVTAQVVTVDDSTVTTLKATGWSAFGVGVVLTTVGVIYGVRAQTLESELADACQTNPCTIDRSAADQKEADGRLASRVFNGAGITGMVLMVSGAAIAIAGHVIEPETHTELQIGASPVHGGFMFGATGRF